MGAGKHENYGAYEEERDEEKIVSFHVDSMSRGKENYSEKRPVTGEKTNNDKEV